MAGIRSEGTPEGYPTIGTKTKYPEYNLTYYPDDIDSRDNNGNMRGFKNMDDYNMAEHLNALTDAIMVMERILGIGVEGSSVDVKTRLNILDQHNHDTRYGGSGWTLAGGQTLVGHTHTGSAGHPSQINLNGEVQGKLSKGFLDLTSTGLTGSDIMMSGTSSSKISDAVNDKLSTSQGGTIAKNLKVEGKFNSRIMREWDSSDARSGSVSTDYTARSNSVIRGSGTGDIRFIHEGIKGFQYGKYVVGVRLKTSSLANENVAYIRMYNNLNSSWTMDSSLYIKGADFEASNEWKTFYLPCDVAGDSSSSYPILHIGKSSTSGSVNIDLDHAFIMPITPAVFDI
jgi:hypothetical protein